MTYNRKALRELRGWAREASQLDLNFWAAEQDCGTTLCLAGSTVVQAGYKISWPPKRAGEVRAATECSQAGGMPVAIEKAAREVLGLSRAEAAQLFVPDLEKAAMGATTPTPSEMPNTSNLEVLMALDFLDHLIGRAHLGLKNMDDLQTADWSIGWEMAHQNELIECYATEES